MPNTMAGLLVYCRICREKLVPNPLYSIYVSQYCPDHGDYFVQRLRDKEPTVIFVPFNEAPERRHVARLKQRIFTTPEDKVPPNHRPSYIIQCNETEEYFYSIGQAANTMCLERTAISLHLRGGRSHVKGYTFKRLGVTAGKTEHSSAPVKQVGNPGTPRVCIQCNETEEIFESLAAAAAALHISRSNLSHHLAGNRNHVGGFTFTRLPPE